MNAFVHLFRRLSLLGLTAAIAAPAFAGVFSVSPVRIFMGPRDRAVPVTITNEGTTPVFLQADINIWSQKADGTDELTLTEDLVLSPPILTLQPGQRQVVRLASLKPVDPERQRTYRMVLREVPPPQQGDSINVTVALSLSMPVFITPPTARPAVDCQITRAAASGALLASCANSGTAYAQIRGLELVRDGRTVSTFEGGVYILPGVRRQVELPGSKEVSAGAAELRISFDVGNPRTQPVTLP